MYTYVVTFLVFCARPARSGGCFPLAAGWTRDAQDATARTGMHPASSVLQVLDPGRICDPQQRHSGRLGRRFLLPGAFKCLEDAQFSRLQARVSARLLCDTEEKGSTLGSSVTGTHARTMYASARVLVPELLTGVEGEGKGSRHTTPQRLDRLLLTSPLKVACVLVSIRARTMTHAVMHEETVDEPAKAKSPPSGGQLPVRPYPFRIHTWTLYHFRKTRVFFSILGGFA